MFFFAVVMVVVVVSDEVPATSPQWMRMFQKRNAARLAAHESGRWEARLRLRRLWPRFASMPTHVGATQRTLLSLFATMSVFVYCIALELETLHWASTR